MIHLFDFGRWGCRGAGGAHAGEVPNRVTTGADVVAKEQGAISAEFAEVAEPVLGRGNGRDPCSSFTVEFRTDGLEHCRQWIIDGDVVCWGANVYFQRDEHRVTHAQWAR